MSLLGQTTHIHIPRMIRPELLSVTPGVLPDWLLRHRLSLPSGDRNRLVIEPFSEGTKKKGCVSYGLSSYGYDARVGTKFKIFANTSGVIVDPLDFDEEKFLAYEGTRCVIPPNSFALAESVEYFEIPKDVICLMLGKSTYARCGICLNMTPLEPEWRGKITIEISNTTPLPAIIHGGAGIGQILFLCGAAPCDVTYQTKGNASYQDQAGLMGPRA